MTTLLLGTMMTFMLQTGYVFEFDIEIIMGLYFNPIETLFTTLTIDEIPFILWSAAGCPNGALEKLYDITPMWPIGYFIPVFVIGAIIVMVAMIISIVGATKAIERRTL